MYLIVKEGAINMKKNAFFLVFIMILFPFISEDKEPLFVMLVLLRYALP